MVMTRLYKTIGEHIIDDMMMAGISVLFFAFGFNYFSLKSEWLHAFSSLPVSSSVHFIEAEMMLRTISDTFPFNLFTGNFTNFFAAAIVGVLLTGIGFALKLLTTKTKEKFIEDLGKELYIPAVLGFLGITALHLVTAFVLQNQVTDAFTIAAKFNAGFIIWKSFGSIFVAGLSTLVIGSVVLLVAKSNKLDKIMVIGRTLLHSGYVLVGYYVFIRLMAFDVILESPIGAFMKVFIIAGDISNAVIIFMVLMFWFGRELKRYGKYLRVKKKYDMHEREEMERLRARIKPILPSPPVRPY